MLCIFNKYLVKIPQSVNVNIQDKKVLIIGPLDSMSYIIPNGNIHLKVEKQTIIFLASNKNRRANMIMGTMQALLNNIILGVTVGFEKKLSIVGIGFRVSKEESLGSIKLNLGFSHDIQYKIPSGIKIECPSQTEIVVKGSDKGLVGQVAADLRSYRRPEPYKGKGIRYSDEVPLIKETKKKR